MVSMHCHLPNEKQNTLLFYSAKVISLLYLITLFHCSGCQFADGFLGCISKTTL